MQVVVEETERLQQVEEVVVEPEVEEREDLQVVQQQAQVLQELVGMARIPPIILERLAKVIGGGGGGAYSTSNGSTPNGSNGARGEVRITYTCPSFGTVSAGTNQTLAACATTTTLAGSAIPAGMTGTWTVVSGTATITSPNSPTSGVTGLVLPATNEGTVTATLRWTISNGECGSSFQTVTITTSRGPECWIYCTPSYSSAGANDRMTNVTLGALNDTPPANAVPGYFDRSGVQNAIPDIAAGSTVNITLTFGSDPNQFSRVWVDFNNNGTFEPGESFSLGTNAGASGTAIIPIVVPAGAVAGITRLRVRGGDDVAIANTQACGASSSAWGQALDYLVNIVIPDDCSGTPVAGVSLASPSAVCSGSSSIVSLSGQTIALGLTYQWEQSDDGVSGWANVTGGSGATTSVYTTPALTSTRFYRCIVTCTISGESSTSSVATVSIIGPGGVYSTISGTSAAAIRWNLATTWLCGEIPPNDGTANVFINHSNIEFDINANINNLTINSGGGLSVGRFTNTTLTINGNFIINSGGTFGNLNPWAGSNQNTHQTIDIKGNFINNGTISRANAISNQMTIRMSGSVPQVIGGNGSGTGVVGGVSTSTTTPPALIISNSSSAVTLQTNFSSISGTNGVIIIENGSRLDFADATTQFTGGGSLSLNGITELKAGTFNAHYAMTGTRTINTGTSRIIFTNPVSNITPTSNIPSADLGSVTTEMGTTGVLTIGAPATIFGELSMLSGDIATTSANLLSLGTSVANPGTLNWVSGTVAGPMRRWFNATANSGNASGLFPIGNNPGAGVVSRWALVEYSSAPATAGYLTAQFMAGAPSIGTNGMPLTDVDAQMVDLVATDGYWDIEPGALSGGNYNLTVRANQFTSLDNMAGTKLIKSPDPHTVWTFDGAPVGPSGSVGDFVIGRTGMSGYSWFAIGYPSALLPVELIRFTARAVDNEYIRLEWTTATEIDNEGFFIERSADGINFAQIGWVDGNGSTAQLQQYVYNDKEAVSGINYYRLKQLDFDGQYEYSHIVAASLRNVNNQLQVLNVRPNPAGNDLYIDIQAINRANAKLTVYDAMGKMMVKQTPAINAGENMLHINTQSLPAGAYIVTLETEQQTVKSRFVVVR
jgi:hypothetical protein